MNTNTIQNLISKIAESPRRESDEAFLGAYLTFQDRESYLAWRQQWREAYRAFSSQIREEKRAFKEAQREGSPGWDFFRTRHAQKATARGLLLLRKLSKLEAGRQMQEALETNG